MLVKRMQLILVSIHFRSKQSLSKRRILVIQESFLVKFVGPISFLEFERVLLSLVTQRQWGR